MWHMYMWHMYIVQYAILLKQSHYSLAIISSFLFNYWVRNLKTQFLLLGTKQRIRYFHGVSLNFKCYSLIDLLSQGPAEPEVVMGNQ